jgi:hypothetical protein
MKKILALSALTLGLFTAANAQQITTNAGTFSKPSAGSKVFEVTFAPNISGVSEGNVGLFSLPSISNSGMTGIKYRNFVSDDKAIRMIANFTLQNNSGTGMESTTNYAAAFGYGVEHHNKGAQRLSTYWGYQGYVGLGSMQGDYDEKVNTFAAGADVLTGFDYYIVPNVYLGLELSYGLGVVNTKEGDYSTTKLQLAPGITPFFRLGWKF